MAPQLPPNMTSAKYKAALAQVAEHGKVRLERARESARKHLESQQGSQVGNHGEVGGRDDDS
jgi:hypothetical protein